MSMSSAKHNVLSTELIYCIIYVGFTHRGKSVDTDFDVEQFSC